MRLLVLLPLLLVPGPFLGQEFTLTVDVPAVSFDVSVVDQYGLPVAGLEADDFEVLENDDLQTIRYFGERAEPFPYYVYLLLDSSGSTANRWDQMDSTVQAFVDAALPHAELSTGLFGSFLDLDPDWKSASEIQSGNAPVLDGRGRGRSTQFYRALREAVSSGVFEDIDARRVLVVMTDGRDSSLYRETLRRGRVPRWHEDFWFTSLLETVRAQNVPISFVAFNTDRNVGFNRGGTDEYRELRRLFPDSPVAAEYLLQVRIRMEEVARVTGGRVLFPKSDADVQVFAAEITQGLDVGYSIGYSPRPGSPGEGTRRITVRLPGRDDLLVVQSQTEYQPR